MHFAKTNEIQPKWLDDKSVAKISAFLFHEGGNKNPEILKENLGKAFQGCVVVGMGFTFDDNDVTGTASSITEMRNVLLLNKENERCVFPYIGGEEINDSPTHEPSRFIINFGEHDLKTCEAKWPELLAIVRAKVKPAREAAVKKSFSKDKEKRARLWWQFSRTAGDLYSSISKLNRVLVLSRVGHHCAFTFSSTGRVFAESLVVFAFDKMQFFGLLQSRTHDIWARFFSSSMKDDLRYTPTTCFETFPFPSLFSAGVSIESPSEAYFNARATHMVGSREGLTSTYNRFHDPQETSTEILKLRELHEAMDRAVFEAYGWSDLAARARCEFLLDYEDDEEEAEPNGKGKGGKGKKKPWRLRWPDEFRDEVLARLLELNEQRHKEELAAGIAPTTSSSSDEDSADSDEDSDPDAGPSADSPATPPPAPRTPTRRRARPSRRPNPGQGELLGE